MKRVLVIDDNPRVLNVLVSGLEQFHYDVEGYCRSASGLTRLAEEPFDVLLCDVNLPEMGGHEVMRRARLRSPELKIVAISGAGFHDLRGPESIDVDATLCKPLRLAELDEVLQSLFGHHEPVAAI